MGDQLTYVFVVLGEVVICEYTIIIIVVLYINVGSNYIVIEELFSEDSIFIRTVFRVVEILQVWIFIHKSSGLYVALLCGNSLQLRNETNLRRTKLVGGDTLAWPVYICLPS